MNLPRSGPSIPSMGTTQTTETTYQRRIRLANEAREAGIAQTRAALARAMERAGFPADAAFIAEGTYQDSYADVTGWAVTADTAEICERAAAWLHTYLTHRGEQTRATGFWLGGWSRAESLNRPVSGHYTAERVLRADARAHVAWIQTGWHSIGD